VNGNCPIGTITTNQNSRPTEKLKTWVLSPELFIIGAANSSRIGTGPSS
jgi:hypothetical protein